jgi:DNA transposition AAA+ family ATPase
MNALNEKEKDAIAGVLRERIDKSSQNKVAAQLSGVSLATVNHIARGNYKNISDEMFRSIAVQLTPKAADEWQYVETYCYKEMVTTFDDAKKYRIKRWIVGEAGCGKSTSANIYAKEHKNVFVILCDEDMKKGDFVREIAKKMGIKTAGLRIREVLDTCMENLIQMESPLLVFDEGDKLNDNVFHYFINIYNRLEDKCGIVFMSTDYIKHRMQTGLRYNKKGYNELHSRIGRKFFELKEVSRKDVFDICRANGLENEEDILELIGEIIAESSKKTTGSYDLRSVKDIVHRIKRLKKA